jgi:hypothetical protein
MSAGFGIGSPPLGGAVTIADLVHTSISVEHTAPRNLASTLMYLDPAGYMDRTIAMLTQDPPSAVVALDYLFWSIHGTKSDAERQRQLEGALSGLEKLSCPIVVGDVPDVTIATTVPSPAISRTMIPAAAFRDSANARIRTWAKAHKNVTVIPLASILTRLETGEAIRIRGNDWKESGTARLLQQDRLHPTIDGLVVLWLATVEEWLKNDSTLDEAFFELRPRTLIDAATARLARP